MITNMNDKSLLSYLKQYTKYLNKNGLNQQYFNYNSKRINLKNKINDFAINYPHYAYLLSTNNLTKYNKQNNQYGGGLTDDIMDKLQNINGVLSEYKKLEHDDKIVTKMQELKNRLNDILLKLNQTDNLDHVVDSNRIINNLEIMTNNLSSFTLEDKNDNKIHIPAVRMNDLITGLTETLNKIKEIKQSYNDNNNIDELKQTLSKNRTEIIDKIKQMNESTKKITKHINDFYKQFEMIENPGDLHTTNTDSNELKKSNDFTMRITNNFIINFSNQQLNYIDLLNEILTTNYNDKTNINDKSINDIEQLYSYQFGGVDNERDILEISNEFIRTYNEYNKLVKKYNVIISKNITHTIFLTLIITHKIFSDNYVIYKYLNNGLLISYYLILDDIVKRIESNDSNPNILYLNKYHYVTIYKLHVFLKYLIDKDLDMNTIIDINLCNGEISKRFTLLNYFKTILETYKVKTMKNVTIYSRINNIPSINAHVKFLDLSTDIVSNAQLLNDFNDRVFLSGKELKKYHDKNINYTINNILESKTDDYDSETTFDFKSMYTKTDGIVDGTVGYCNDKTINKLNKFEFTQTFDSTFVKNSANISFDMALAIKLSQGESMAIMTYGYSGTGKTYTMFGNENETGILQSTLNNIIGLESIEFRIFEIYGLGLTYPYYWINKQNNETRFEFIEHKIFGYNLNLLGDVINIKNEYEISGFENIESYMSDNQNETTYIKINNASLIESVFKKFTILIDSVDKKRKETQRIRDTPNNPESSRSILIYDFKMKLEGTDKYSNFLIMDLPGRENIINTYIEPFFENEGFKQLYFDNETFNNNDKNKEILLLKLLFSSMALNPIAISLFSDPDIILEYVRKNYIRMEKIFNERIDMKFEFNKHMYENKTKKSDLSKYIIKDENDNITNLIDINPQSKSKVKKRVNEIDSKTQHAQNMNNTYDKKLFITRPDKFELLDEIINLTGGTLNNLFTYTRGKFTLNSKASGFGYGKFTKLNYSLLCIHIINRLLLLKRFDIIKEIYEQITNTVLNDRLKNNFNNNKEKYKKIITDMQYKGEFIKNKNNEIIDTDIIYDYYLTPFEGIYINENISGLLKYLGKKINQNINIITQQSNELEFQTIQKDTRVWLTNSESINSINDINNFYNLDDKYNPTMLFNININDDINKQLSLNDYNEQSMNEIYNKIKMFYSSNKLFVYDNPLIEDILKNYTDTIDDYKLFYLFANYEDEKIRKLKCKQQISLLNDTSNFIDIIIH